MRYVPKNKKHSNPSKCASKKMIVESFIILAVEFYSSLIFNLVLFVLSLLLLCFIGCTVLSFAGDTMNNKKKINKRLPCLLRYGLNSQLSYI